MKRINFSCKDKLAIAEYIYSYAKNLLLRQDARNLVKVLFKHEILFNLNSWLKSIEEKDDRVATKLINLIEGNISKEQLVSIMREYYGVPVYRTTENNTNNVN